MPLTRYQSRNEYGLADPDLYQAADKDDPEALLEGVAMAGLVGILRQLGDLAEFAAEMFHDLHEEVMATASRSHGLMARVQQLEAEFPFVEKALLCQTDHTPFFSTKGVEWHPNLQLEQTVVTRGDLPRCVMDSYEECRGPPRLFLLDKFDISGAGACLKRYTDPSFVRHERSSYEASWDDKQREKKSQKAKRRASPWRNGGTPENALTSHAKLHELFLEEHLEARQPDPARVVKLKTRKLDGYSLISKSGESYMERFVQTSVDNKTGYQIIAPNLELSTWNMDRARDVVTDKPHINLIGALEKSHRGSRAEVLLSNEQEKVGLIEKDIETVPESTYSAVPSTTITKNSQTTLNEKAGFLQHRSCSEDLTSEAENYVDAPATMESETETEDECRPKKRSGDLTDGNFHTYSDAAEERMKSPPQFSFFHSAGNTPASENGQSSVGKRSTSFSYSDSASISIDGQSDGEKLSECLPSISSVKSELVDSTSHMTPEASKLSHNFNVQKSVSSSSADRQRSFSSSDTCSSPRTVSQNLESCSLTVQSLAPEVIETSPELVGRDLIKEGDDGSKVDPVCSSKSGASFDVKNSNFPSESSSVSSTSEGSRCDNVVEKNCMVDYSSTLVNSGSSPQVFVDSQTGEQISASDNDIETNSTVACSKALANSGSDTKSCDGSSLTGKLLPCSAGMGVEVSRDMHSGTVDKIDFNDTLDDETNCVTVTNAVDDSDSQSSVAEISNEHSCAFSTTADASVSEFPENSLENGISVPAEVDSKLISDSNSEREKLVGDESPTCRKFDEHNSDNQSHLSDMHEDGSHDFPGLDDAVADIVPKVEFAVSDNHAGTSSDDDVNHAVSLSSTASTGSLPWISTNTYRTASKAGEIGHDTVVDSNKTLPVENRLVAEKEMQESPLEVSSKGLGTPLDNHDRASCESLSSMTSLDQNDRDTETKSPCKGILVDNCIDCSPVNKPNVLENVTNAQSVKVQTPCVSQILADEELLQPSVSGGVEFVPQSAGIELSSPEQESKLNPTFPRFGLIPEATSPNQEDMPPLPPLPPMQWRIGKVSHSFFPSFMGESLETSSSALSAEPLAGSSLNSKIGSEPSELSVSLGSDESDLLPGEFVNSGSEKPLRSSSQFTAIGTDLSTQYDSSGSQRTQSEYPSADLLVDHAAQNHELVNPLELSLQLPQDPSAKLPTMTNQGEIQDFGSEENNLLADHAAQNHELVYPQELSLQLPQDPSAKLPTMTNEGGIEDFGSKENNLLADHAAQNHELVYPQELSLQLSQEPSAKLPTVPKQVEREDFGSEENNLLADRAAQNHELVYSGESSEHISQDPSVEYKDFEDDTDVNVSESSKDHDTCPETEALMPTQSTMVEDNGHSVPDASNAETAEPSTSSAQKIIPGSLGDAMWPVRSFSVAPTLDINKLEEVPMVKFHRPRSPLVDAVAAHDRRTMKKVSERVQPPIKSKQDDKNSLLAQIRSKSISLKPAVATRPSIQTGPKTNLRVAAILEKANTIRQAMAGSDEDEDSDSWSDS